MTSFRQSVVHLGISPLTYLRNSRCSIKMLLTKTFARVIKLCNAAQFSCELNHLVAYFCLFPAEIVNYYWIF